MWSECLERLEWRPDVLRWRWQDGGSVIGSVQSIEADPETRTTCCCPFHDDFITPSCWNQLEIPHPTGSVHPSDDPVYYL